MPIVGNTAGVPRRLLEEMETWLQYQVNKDQLMDEPLALALGRYTAQLKREVAVYLNRQGRVVYWALGKESTAPLQDLSGRLRGCRCIHTHPGGDGTLSDADLSALDQLGLTAMVALGVEEDGSLATVGCAWPTQEEPTPQPRLLAGLPALLAIDWQQEQWRLAPPVTAAAVEPSQEGAILVALSGGRSAEDTAASLQELSRLAATAGLRVLAQVSQNRRAPCAATYIGRGKVEELAMLAQNLAADVLLFDDEISPAAQNNLERLTGRKVIDRNLLSLDIFAQRARSNEGKLQVELAQLRYLLPRLMGQGTVLSRLGGGIGTRGPGETQLEMDRRQIRRRIQELENRLEEALRTRRLQQRQRNLREIPLVALVGYTNAGKSTLLNALAGADAWAADQLFATLDALTRRVTLPSGRLILVSDTVGFIRRLPPFLIAAFRSTLEQVREADLLLHVVDGAAEDATQQAAAVLEVLRELAVLDKPVLTVINKRDQVANEAYLQRLTQLWGEGVAVSARQGQGLDALLAAIEGKLPPQGQLVEVLLPFAAGELLHAIHQQGQVLAQEYETTGVRVRARVTPQIYARLKQEELL